MSPTTLTTTRNQRAGLPIRIARRVIDAYREQVAKETRELLVSQLTALDRLSGTPSAMQLPDRGDPLEQLLRLPARYTRTPHPARNSVAQPKGRA